MEISRLVVILLLIISLIVIGSKVVYKDNFTVLNGTYTVTLEEGTDDLYESTHINYPTGFNKSNCVVIAFGLKQLGGDTDRGFTFGTISTHQTRALLAAGIGKGVRLTDNDIVITTCYEFGASHSSLNYTFEYQLTLMKIS